MSLSFLGYTDSSSRLRQLWVDAKGGSFNPPEQPLVKKIYETMQGMMPVSPAKEKKDERSEE